MGRGLSVEAAFIVIDRPLYVVRQLDADRLISVVAEKALHASGVGAGPWRRTETPRAGHAQVFHLLFGTRGECNRIPSQGDRSSMGNAARRQAPQRGIALQVPIKA